MSKRRISISDIIIGQPLPWNVFSGDGRLLLRAGEIVATENQAERMVKEGLFSEIADVGDLEEIVISPKDEPSVIRILNRANWLLRKSLPALAALPNAQKTFTDIATLVYSSLELDTDVAIATIFLNQQPGGPYFFRHCTDAAVVAALVARAMGKPKEEIINCIAAALTSNLGMLDYHEHLDNKKGPLTQAEKDHVRTHPEHSVEMLRNAGVADEAWLSYVANHHENIDGSGYPHGRVGDEIPLYAKLISLADRYCARVTSKDYRKAALPNIALRDVFLSKNKEIDPDLAPYFIQNIGLYPPGSFVRLKNYEVGVVVKRGDKPNNPIVMSVLNPTGMPQSGKLLRNTGKAEFAVQEAVHKEIAGANLGMQRFWGALAAF
jgi:hypothetical protein